MRILSCLVLTLLVLLQGYAQAGTLNDELMGLVPSDSAVILVVDQFRDRSREIFASEIAKSLADLPAVRAWFQSDQGKQLLASRAELERTLGVSLEDVRDEVFGDRVVLALHLNPGGKSSDPAGLFLTRARKRATLETMIAALNKAEIAENTLKTVEVVPGQVTSAKVYHRHFQANTKPDEWYCVFDDNTFAWSNSETLIRGVVDRKSKLDGLTTSARYRSTRDALPEKAILRLYLDPVLICTAASQSKTPHDPNVIAILGAFDYVGAALEWHDGPILHLHQSINAGKLSISLSAGRSEDGETGDVLSRVPRTAIAVASWHWDLPKAFDVLASLVPENDRPRFKASKTAIEGLLMGKDLRDEILPALKPGGVAFVDIPSQKRMPEIVAAVDISNNREVAAALENGLRTVSSFVSLDKSRKGAPIQIEDELAEGVRVTRVTAGKHAASFAATAQRFVLNTNRKSVPKGFGGAVSPSQADGPIGKLRAGFFATSDGFLAIDVAALHAYANANRDKLVAHESENRGENGEGTSRDFDRALRLIEPFGGAFVSWTLARDGRSAHQSIGLVGRAEHKTR